ncbi:MAG TPA: hypothetical protein VM122_00585 [Usitatibacter sp.]|nr:hypothetical protein [Usitatibacter sp.]
MEDGIWFTFTADSEREANVAARRIEQYARGHRHERDGVNAITVLRSAATFYFSPLAARALAPLVELYRATPLRLSGKPPNAPGTRQFNWREAQWSSVDG